MGNEAGRSRSVMEGVWVSRRFLCAASVWAPFFFELSCRDSFARYATRGGVHAARGQSFASLSESLLSRDEAVDNCCCLGALLLVSVFELRGRLPFLSYAAAVRPLGSD